MSNGNISPATPVARLCHIVKWDDFDGYGFNLHAEKGKPGQFIGKVDDGSPAEAAGLKEGDRIVEVNGVNIANENHKQVVQRIKAVAEETKLLVVDAEADKHFKSNNVVIKSSLPGVVNLKTPVPRIAENGHNGRHSEDTQSSKSENEIQPENSSCKGSSVATTPSSDRKRSLGSTPEPSPEHHHDETDEIPTSVSPTATNGSGGSASSGNSSANGTLERVNNSLNLNMTAAELRAQLAARKNRKFEVKRESIDFKQKYEIIQKL